MKRFSSVLFAITFTIQFLFSQSATAQEKDFAVKGFHLDLRVQVMKMDALKAFAKKLSEQGKIIHRFVLWKKRVIKNCSLICLQNLLPHILQNIFISVVMKLIYLVTVKNAKQKLPKKVHRNYT